MNSLDNILDNPPILKIAPAGHAWKLIVSQLLQNFSFYGLRTIIVVYLIGNHFQLTTEDALTIFGTFTGSLLIAMPLGGIVGDFLLNSRRSMLLGGALQILGGLCLLIPVLPSVYIGLGLIALGFGLYQANLRASIAKHYLNQGRKMDIGWGLLFAFGTLGSFLGIYLCSYFGEVQFIWGLLLPLAAIVLSTLTSKAAAPTHNSAPIKQTKTYTHWGVLLILAASLLALFEVGKEIWSGVMYNELELPIWTQLGHQGFWGHFPTLLPFIVFFLGILFWTYSYSSHWTKAGIAFICAAVAAAIPSFVPIESAISIPFIFIISFVLMNLAEIYSAPVLYSTINRRIKPKYFGTAFGLSSSIFRLGFMVPLFYFFFSGDTLPVVFVAGLFLCLGVLILGVYYSQRGRIHN